MLRSKMSLTPSVSGEMVNRSGNGALREGKLCQEIILPLGIVHINLPPVLYQIAYSLKRAIIGQSWEDLSACRTVYLDQQLRPFVNYF